MSVAFIECEEFWRVYQDYATGRIEFECCRECHTNDALIYIRPKKADGTGSDWTLCIEGVVCCQLHHFVSNLPREWWVKRAIDLGVRRDDSRGYVFPSSPSRDTDQPRQAAPVAKAARVRRAMQEDNERERSGGLANFLKRR